MYKIEVKYTCDGDGLVKAKIRVTEADEGFNKFILGSGTFSQIEVTVEGATSEAARAAAQGVIRKAKENVERRRENSKFCMSQVETYTI